MSDQPTNEELAGYLLWYCGGMACAITYARAAKLPEVAEVLVKRAHVHYHPPQDKVEAAAMNAAWIALESGKTEDEISRAAVEAAEIAQDSRGVDGDDFCPRCGLPLTQCICKPRKL